MCMSLDILNGLATYGISFNDEINSLSDSFLVQAYARVVTPSSSYSSSLSPPPPSSILELRIGKMISMNCGHS